MANEFEKYPELSSIIEWFANNIKVPGTEWNKLLSEINKALSPSPSSPEWVEREAEKYSAKWILSPQAAKEGFLAGYSLASDRMRELEEMLKELVYLKHIKDGLYSVMDDENRKQLEEDYNRRKPLAWQKAKSLITPQ